jgi:hypothetical protein
VIYFLLFLVWIYVLDSKIRQGPEDVAAERAATKQGWLGTATRRTAASSPNSLTSARRPQTGNETGRES